MKDVKIAACAVVMISVLSACQSTSEPRTLASETNQPVQEHKNTLKIYESAKANYENWLKTMEQSQSLRLYSNERVEELFEAWDDAVDVYAGFASDPGKATKDYSVFSDGTYAETFDVRLAKVTELHAELMALKARADGLLAEAIAEMAYLEQIGAPEQFSSRFKRLNSDYRELFEYVADNDIDDAQVEQAVFLEKAKKLEVAVVLKTHIDPLKEEIRLLKREGFQSVAPISFTKTNAALEQAVALVSANPRDEAVIADAVATVAFEIDHVEHIGQEVKRFRNVDDGKFEPLVLELENRLHAIAKAIEEQDLRNKPIHQQTALLAEQVQTLNAAINSEPESDPQLAALMAKLDQVKGDLSAQEQENQALTAQLSTLKANSLNNGGINESANVVEAVEAVQPEPAENLNDLPLDSAPKSSLNAVPDVESEPSVPADLPPEV